MRVHPHALFHENRFFQQTIIFYIFFSISPGFYMSNLTSFSYSEKNLEAGKSLGAMRCLA